VDATQEQFEAQFHAIARLGDTYFIYVVEKREAERKRIVASGRLVIELKFTRSCGRVRALTPTMCALSGQVGHLEDIVVDEKERGLRLGTL
jgi:hypothetical protein